MTSTFHGIEIAKRSLFTQQAALETTGHNIANANTTGYSRQTVNMTASRPIEAPGLMRSAMPGQLGTGVEFESITRVREKFLDDQFRNENNTYGNWTIQSDTMDKLQAVFNEPSNTGLRSVIDNFWKSWSDLSKDPGNLTNRKIVRQDALALTDAFHSMSSQLNNLSSDLTNNIDTKVSEINSTISNIADLNKQIARIEGTGDKANDLSDQRDQLTDQLSKIVNINVQDTNQGYTIKMGGNTLVSGITATPTSSSSLGTAMASGDLKSGEIYGMLTSRDKYVADYQNQLDTLANTLANGDVTVTIPAGSVLPDGTVLNGTTYTGASRTLSSDLTVTVKGLNGLHKLGYTLNSPVQPGGDFFTASSGTTITAGNIQLSTDIVNNASNIATSMRTTGSGAGETAVTGNNTLALLVSQLQDTKFNFNSAGTGSIISQGTPSDFFRSTVGQLGVQAQEATRQVGNQKVILDQVDSRRQSVSGVSLDEEMSNMIKYQHAYAAAARVMTTFDQMLDKIINSMGLVGR